MPNDKKLDRIYKEISEELGISHNQAETAVRHQFFLVREIIEEGELETIRLPLWGKFFVKKRKNGPKPKRRKRNNTKKSSGERGDPNQRELIPGCRVEWDSRDESSIEGVS